MGQEEILQLLRAHHDWISAVELQKEYPSKSSSLYTCLVSLRKMKIIQERKVQHDDGTGRRLWRLEVRLVETEDSEW